MFSWLKKNAAHPATAPEATNERIQNEEKEVLAHTIAENTADPVSRPDIIQPADLIEGFEYPKPYLALLEHHLLDFDDWAIMDAQEQRARFEGLRSRYPARKLIPFARRYSNDDVACFGIITGEQVLIIHDYASPGWENRASYSDVWAWLHFVIDEMKEFVDDDE